MKQLSTLAIAVSTISVLFSVPAMEIIYADTQHSFSFRGTGVRVDGVECQASGGGTFDTSTEEINGHGLLRCEDGQLTLDFDFVQVLAEGPPTSILVYDSRYPVGIILTEGSSPTDGTITVFAGSCCPYPFNVAMTGTVVIN
jgi:hypothetical protein